MAGDLLYVNEHTTCRHYVSDYRCRFRYVEYEKGETFSVENEPYNILVYFLEGETTVYCNEFKDRIYTAKHIAFIPKSAVAGWVANQKTRVLSCQFAAVNNVCDKFNLQSYWPLCSEMKYNFDPIEIKHQMFNFIDSLSYYLSEGINCEHFHEMKLQEMFLILRWFYSKDLLAEMFFPIMGKSLDFKQVVLENYLKINNISELAELLRMGRSNFDAMFKEEFGMPAHQWILQQRAKHIKFHLAEPNTTIGEVMNKFNFNSPTQFTRFCKQQFGRTPSELKAEMKPD